MKEDADQLQLLQQELDKLRKATAKDIESRGKLLKVSEERYLALAENIPVGLYRRTCGPSGVLVMANRAMTEILGYTSADELVGRPVTDIYWDPSESKAFSDSVLKNGEVVRRELRLKKKDGVCIWAAVTTKLMCDEEGKPSFFDGIVEDITARKSAQEQDALRQKELMQIDKMITLGILVSGVAHEINNPNQFIMSHISPLREAWEDALPILDRYFQEHGDFLLGGKKYSLRRADIGEMFSGIMRGSHRIKSIVDELRDYAREHPLNLAGKVDVNAVVRSSLALLDNLVRKASSHFSSDCSENLPAVRGDYHRLEQVVINLIQNACQALPDKSRAVLVRTRTAPPENAVIIEVIDEGVGISPEDLKHVTDPFFTTKRSQGGIGLGLSISSSIVEKHGGKLQFESEQGKGTTVRVVLPAMIEPERKEPATS